VIAPLYALPLLAHDGTKAYHTTFDLIYRREAEKPNDIWQADHMLLDLWVKQDSGPPARPWLTAISVLALSTLEVSFLFLLEDTIV
jgi:hypothetical protein